MVTKTIYSVICLFILIIPVFSNNLDSDNPPIEIGWIDLSVSYVSDNGNWAIIQKKQNNLFKSFLVNTHTKEKKEISGKKHIDIQEDNFIYLDNDNTLNVLDINSNMKREIGQCKKASILRDLEAVCYIENNTNTFLLTKLKNLNQELVINNIENYFINDEQSYVILLKKTDVYSLYQLDLNTLNETKIKEIDSNNIQVIWSKNNDKVAIIIDLYKILSINLKNSDKKLINLEENSVNTSIIFLPNDDLYISRLLQTEKLDNNDDFVDIWYGNDRELENKTLPNKKYTTTLKQSIYSHAKQKLIPIKLDENIRPLVINHSEKILVYNPFTYNDYTSYIPKTSLNLLDIVKEKTTLLIDSISDISKNISYSPNGNFISYIFNNQLIVYNLKSDRKYGLTQILNPKEVFWTTDSASVLIIGKNAIWIYDLKNNKLNDLLQLSDEDYKIDVLNRKNNLNGLYQGFGVLPKYIDEKVSPLIHIINYETNENYIYKITATKQALLLYKTNNKLSQIHWNKSLKTIVFREENFNLPPNVKVINKKILSNLMENETPHDLYNWRKQKIIYFTDKFNVSLKGILYFPKHFENTKKYPMITKIYEQQFFLANTFYTISDQANNGFNIPLLNELDYFVFLPDTYVSKEGPGVSALNCVSEGINSAINEVDSIDKNKLGLVGSSFGGYETNFIVSQTNLFAAAVSGAAINDIVWHYYSYNYDFPKPSYWRFEKGQYQINKSFGQVPDLYINNSPLYHAHKIKTPILSFTGLEDRNVPWEHTRHFYTALKRYNIPHIALFYKNNGHVITTPQATKDLTSKMINWFDYFLKGNKEIEWISEGVE